MAGALGDGMWRFRAGGPVVDFLFVAVAAPALAAFGSLARDGAAFGMRFRLAAVPEALPGWGHALLGAWVAAGAVVALVLPVAALAVWGGDPRVRRALVPYALVLAVQVLIEAAFAAIYFPSIVAVVGFVFTLYRLRQLWLARWVFNRPGGPQGRARSVVDGVLFLGLGFWATNAAFLFFVALPDVVRPF